METGETGTKEIGPESSAPRWLYPVIGFVILAILATSLQKPRGGSLVEGQAAPAFNLLDPGGASVSLAGLRGKVVLIHFWSSSCGVCRSEFPELNEFVRRYAGRQDLAILGVNTDAPSAEELQMLQEKLQLGFPTLLDPNNAAAAAYGVTGVPETYIIDRQGALIKKVIGPLEWTSERVISFIDQTLGQGL